MKREPPKPCCLKIVVQAANIGAHLRPDVGVGGDRRAALVLVPLAGQIGAEGDVSVGQQLFQFLSRRFLVGRVDVRVHEKNRHRLDAEFTDRDGEFFQARNIERRYHFALAAHAFGYFEAQLAWNQRLIALIVQIERVGTVATGDFENIAEALGGNQCGLRTFALDQRIDHQRRAVVDD